MYQEYAFGYSRNLVKNLRVGARIKILQGFYSVKSNIKSFEFNTSQEIWDFSTEGDIYSSTPFEFIEKEDGTLDSVKFSEIYDDMSAVELIKDNLFKFSNLGIAADFGAVYDLNESWSFSASVIESNSATKLTSG